MRLENARIETQLEKERENKKRLMLEISELEKTIDDINSKNVKENDNNELSRKTISLDNEVDVLFSKIKSKKLIDEFIEIVNRIGESEQGWISNEYWDKSTNYFVKLGLLSSGKSEQNYSELSLTTVGEKVLRRSRLEID